MKYQEYLQPSKFIPMLDAVLDRHDNNIGISLMSDVYNIYKYLETKLTETRTIQQFRQVTDTYNNLFLVDPMRQWNQGTTDNTDQLIIEEYNLKVNKDINMLIDSINSISNIKTIVIGNYCNKNFFEFKGENFNFLSFFFSTGKINSL